MTAEESIAPIVAASERFATGAHQRLAALANLGSDLTALQAAIGAQGWTLGGLVTTAAVLVAASIATFTTIRRLTDRPSGLTATGRHLALLAAVAAAVAVGWLVAAAAVEQGPFRRALMPLVVLTPAALLMRAAVIWTVLPGPAGPANEGRSSLESFARRIGLAIASAFVGTGSMLFLRQLGAGPGLADAATLAFVAFPFMTFLVSGYVAGRRAIATELLSHTRGLGWIRRVAAVWPAIAIGLAVVAFLVAQVFITVGQRIHTIPAISTLLLLLLSPHVDARIARWADRGLGQIAVTPAKVAFRRTLRPAVLTLILVALLAVWSAPIAGLTGLTLGDTLRPTIAIGAIVLASAFVQNLLGVAVDRALEDERPVADQHDDEIAPRSRLGTLLPLVAGVAKIATVTLSGLTILLALGVNIWPLITGLSVFGLAIGFGSQTLVKDIVSGLFFLFDDAFRHGEYIETSGAKGTVEKISIRSVSLRHPRGAVATVPYGQIGKITNFSRDWAIVKMTFRVAFDTDVDKVRKLFKAIGQELLDDPELAPDIIETFKSQGIAEVDEGTLILRGKFKARAGHQFNTRKAVMAKVHKVFRENGIRTVPRPLTPDVGAQPAA
jgi:moderate conductance mechanosensitive channel